MSEQDDALKSLQESGLLPVLEWAAPVAFEMTRDDYDEERGHDQVIVGIHNFVHLRDLLDRATSNGRFIKSADSTGAGTDVVRRGITPAALDAMPVVAEGTIERIDYEQSPGWAANGYRVLLQSYPYGTIDKIKWGKRSKAKERVAQQPYVAGVTLFDDADYGLESMSGIPDDERFDGITLVAAHAFDPVTGNFELFIGLSKNPERRGDTCWHWHVQLLSGGSGGSGERIDLTPALPGSPASSAAAEIEVPLRKTRSGEITGAGNG
jgi:hypothetical protein